MEQDFTSTTFAVPAVQSKSAKKAICLHSVRLETHRRVKKNKIRDLLSLNESEVVEKAGNHLVVCNGVDHLHKQMATDIADIIIANNKQDRATKLILPVGPFDQYPLLAEIIRNKNISLENCWFFFMDEYCDDTGVVLPKEHPLSFKGVGERLFLSRLPKSCKLSPERVVFPDENNIDELSGLISSLGGIDVCFGGIGICGHVAFNEPEEGIAHTDPRKVRLNDFTVTINAIRAQVGGNIENFPRYAYTLGMRQILDANEIRLYCRSGAGFDWANTILRIALFA